MEHEATLGAGKDTPIGEGPGDGRDREAIKGTVQLHTEALGHEDRGLGRCYVGRV